MNSSTLLHVAENDHCSILHRKCAAYWMEKCRIHLGFGCLYWCVAVYSTSQPGQPYLLFSSRTPRQTTITHSGSTCTSVSAARTTPGIHYAGLSAPRGLFPKAQEGVSRRASPLGDGFRACLGKRNCQERISCAAEPRTDAGRHFQYGQAVQRVEEEGGPPSQGQIRMLNMQVSL
jgi:hypothetical protein